MATITTDTFLDGGVARTAGETWTMNGGILTIRTDTRVHANAPASMTGSLGALTVSPTLGGGVLVDARNVREVAFNSGGGTVPAIGTLITQGGVTGYLLAVYANLTSAPTAVGAAMPATGIIKFREVTGGAFAAGALSGITASATGADVASWLEVVADQAIAVTVPRLGFFRTRGTWYQLGVTSGSAAQVVQLPTNGGGAGTHVPGLWIETGVGTNQYEFYPAVLNAVFIAANFGTDARSKVVETLGSGQIRIGNNGTVNVGFTPPAGCRIRVPNIFMRQCTTAARATNQAPNATLATRPDFTTTSAGVIDMEYTLSDWYHLFASPYQVIQKYGATFDILSVSNAASPLEFEDYHVGHHLGGQISLTLAACSLGGTVTNCKFYRTTAASGGYAVSVSTSDGIDFTNVEAGIMAFARNAAGYAFYINQSLNLTFNNCRQFNQQMYFNTSFDCVVNDLDHVDRYVGTTNATTPLSAVGVFNSSDNIMVDGVTFGLAGAIANCHPYTGVFQAQNSSNLTFRNVGTAIAPVSGGSANQVGVIYTDSGVNTNVRLQRCYLTATRTNVFSSVNTSKGFTLENCVGTVGAIVTASLNSLIKGVRAASNSVTGQASVYGTHFFDMFYNDTTGGIWFAFNEPTAFNAAYISTTFGVGAGFTSGGQAAMPNIGDQVIFETPYFVKGYTAFQNVAPTLTGTNTGNFTYEYQIDTGSGYGAWKTLNATNLSGETISPSTGFKIKVRVTTSIASTTNALTYVRVSMTTTLVAQQSNVYPLDLATINISGLTANSRVQLYDVTNAVELYNGVVAGTSLSLASEYLGDFTVRIRVMYQSGTNANKFVEFSDTVTASGLSRSVTPESDAIYVANAIDGSAISNIQIIDGTLLVEVDTGVVSLQQIYAYETYWLYTEEGIRDESRFITAVDQANYIFEDFKIKNVQAGSTPLVITGGYMKDSVTEEAIDVIDITGGTIFLAPEHVVPFSTSGGGGGDTKEDIYTYFTSAGRQNTFKADVSGLATEANATSNKNEILTEIGGISAGGYDDTILISKVDAIDAIVDAIKVKTDGISFTGANINAIAQVVSDKTGYALTSGERTAIASAVEAALLNELDGQAVLDAIVDAIGNSNVDEIALVAAIRTDLERAGGGIDVVNENVKKASLLIPASGDF